VQAPQDLIGQMRQVDSPGPGKYRNRAGVSGV